LDKKQWKGETKMRQKGFSCTLLVIGLTALLVAGVTFSISHAQGKFPSRPLTIICPWGAGGASDSTARLLSVLLQKELGQPVNVVNRTGGGGAVGHTAGATASPDGYTMTLTTVELAQLHWMGLAQITYKDLRGIALYAFFPAAVSVRTDSPWNSLKELQDYIKANPGKLKSSGTGKGGSFDLARAGWLKAAGIPIDALPWVPSNGAAPALQDLLAGGIQVVNCSLNESRAVIEGKKVKALAVMDDNRSPIFPDVPTLKELGINWSAGAWLGLTVPKGTPSEVVAVLEKAMEKTVKDPQFAEFMLKNGYTLWYKNAADFDKFLAQEDEIKGALMKEAGIIK
jgi:tripartite-type tricarboxylate transporter receptor subunit TctC